MLKRSSYLVLVILLFVSCSKDGGNPINLFSIQDDIALGQQVNQEIMNDPQQFPILDENQYPEAYQHLNRIKNTILNSGQLQYRNEFAWEVKIIHDDSILNAFALPGGYSYVYTGLIKYLDSEDHFAGVLGHEFAHADRRHSTNQLTRTYGISVLLSVVLGNDPGALAEIAAALVTLRFSRANESDADMFSVKYLCPTEYKANGAAGFFQKIIDQGQAAPIPEFLSTHPNPDNRVEEINNEAIGLGCTGTAENITLYEQFKASLP